MDDSGYTGPGRDGSSETPLAAHADRVEAELLSFPARYLPELPVATRIKVEHSGIQRGIVLSTRACPSRPEALCFDGDELRALVVGVEGERVRATDFTAFCLLKLHDPSFRLTEAIALAGASGSVVTDPWPLGKVLHQLGLRLTAVEVGEREPVRPGVRAA